MTFIHKLYKNVLSYFQSCFSCWLKESVYDMVCYANWRKLIWFIHNVVKDLTRFKLCKFNVKWKKCIYQYTKRVSKYSICQVPPSVSPPFFNPIHLWQKTINKCDVTMQVLMDFRMYITASLWRRQWVKHKLNWREKKQTSGWDPVKYFTYWISIKKGLTIQKIPTYGKVCPFMHLVKAPLLQISCWDVIEGHSVFYIRKLGASHLPVDKSLCAKTCWTRRIDSCVDFRLGKTQWTSSTVPPDSGTLIHLKRSSGVAS